MIKKSLFIFTLMLGMIIYQGCDIPEFGPQFNGGNNNEDCPIPVPTPSDNGGSGNGNGSGDSDNGAGNGDNPDDGGEGGDGDDNGGDGDDDSDNDRPSNGQQCEVNEFVVCHYPRGNPDNNFTICIGSENAVDAHLRHEDEEGYCEEDLD